jgi:hypothetical protein
MQSPPLIWSQMVYLKTKNPYLGKFWRVLQWKMLIHFMAIWYILFPFGMFYGSCYVLWHLVVFSRFGKLHQEKSGNPKFGVDCLTYFYVIQQSRLIELQQMTASVT